MIKKIQIILIKINKIQKKNKLIIKNCIKDNKVEQAEAKVTKKCKKIKNLIKIIIIWKMLMIKNYKILKITINYNNILIILSLINN